MSGSEADCLQTVHASIQDVGPASLAVIHANLEVIKVVRATFSIKQ